MQLSKRLILLILAGFSSAAGFVLRYFQLKYELLADGSLTEGAFLHTTLLVLSAVLVLVSAFLLWKFADRSSWKELANRKLLPIAALVAAAALLFGNAFVLFKGVAPVSPYATSAPGFSNFLTQLLPPLGIAAALCLAVFSYKCYVGDKPSALLYMAISLYLVVRLIVHFQAWNTDPSIHDYCYALLANISAMLAAFHVAGFSFDKGKRRMNLFWLVCALFFSSITLADAIFEGSLGETFVYLALILMICFNLDQLLYANRESQPSED